MSKTTSPLTFLCRAQTAVTRIKADISARQGKEDARRQKFVDMQIALNARLAEAERDVVTCENALGGTKTSSDAATDA